MNQAERDQVNNSINKYKWYHRISVAGGIHTPPGDEGLQSLWDFILSAMRVVDLGGKRVLDVGCRDGLFSFEAERRGAAEVIGIDNDLSQGTTEFLIPYFKSKVRMQKMNVYDLAPETFGTFDVIFFFGVLYHLRYPVWGLKKLVDCLSDGGFLLVESGMLTDPRYEDVDLIYCPFEDSPYEPTSCTFFNQKGLGTTMRSLGCEFLSCKTLGKDFAGKKKNESAAFPEGQAANPRPRVERQRASSEQAVSHVPKKSLHQRHIHRRLLGRHARLPHPARYMTGTTRDESYRAGRRKLL